MRGKWHLCKRGWRPWKSGDRGLLERAKSGSATEAQVLGRKFRKLSFSMKVACENKLTFILCGCLLSRTAFLIDHATYSILLGRRKKHNYLSYSRRLVAEDPGRMKCQNLRTTSWRVRLAHGLTGLGGLDVAVMGPMAYQHCYSVELLRQPTFRFITAPLRRCFYDVIGAVTCSGAMRAARWYDAMCCTMI